MRRTASVIFLSSFLTVMFGQQAPTAPALTTVPRLVRISNSFHPANGLAASPVEGVTLSIYREEHSGVALWHETQNVNVDTEGRYAVLMGSTLTDGMPLELFTAGEPRWLGVQFNRSGEVEQPRVLLTSVPYALKAVDAETLGGLPASAYLVSPSFKTPGAPSPTTGAASGTALQPRATSGVANFIPKFINTTDLGDSVLYQNGLTIGLNTANPADYLHVAFSDASGSVTGYAVQNMGSGAASYSGMLFYDQNGALGQFQGFNNSTHEYRINNVAAGASINFMLGSASKFQVRSDGDINIAGSLRKGGTLFLHNIGTGNTALGLNALAVNTANNNTAVGFQALQANTSGTLNTAVGESALLANNIGSVNTAVGIGSLQSNTVGGSNTAQGVGALASNTTGNNNTADGLNALQNNTTGSNNIALGFQAAQVVLGSNNIHIGNVGIVGDNNTIRIGTSGTQSVFFAAGIRGVTTGFNDALSVVIDSNGQLGTTSSSRRYKEDIQDMGETSLGLMRLRPVTFRYKKPFADGSKPIQYGLIAEEVAEVYPELVAHSADGQVESVKYQVLDSMLLNEVQRQQVEIGTQKEQIRLLQDRLARLETALASLSNAPRVP